MPDPIVNITFGDGTPNPAPALPAGKTEYTYTASLCPGPGEYTVARNNISCSPLNGWNIKYQDHTFMFNETAYEGYMMLVNTYTINSRLYYADTVRGLCDNASYLFSAAVGSLGKCPGAQDGLNVRFIVESLSGTELANTGSPQSFNPALRGALGVYFDLPAGETGVVLKLISRFPGHLDCGEKIYIDDIQLRPSDRNKPKLKMAFSNSADLVKSVCYQANASIPMEGNIIAGQFADPAFQWQLSHDQLNWTDIPGATTLTYTPTFSIPDVYYFRVRASERTLIGNPYCSMVSGFVTVRVDGIPDNIVVSSNSPVCAGSAIRLNAEGAASYVWTGPNGFYDVIPYPGKNQATLADSGMYYVQSTSAGGCKALDSIFVSVIGTDIRVSADTAICKGTSAYLMVTGGSTYSWAPDATLNTSLPANPVATPAASTLYTVTAIDDASGCSDTASVHVRIMNSMEVKAVIKGPDYFCRPADTATFINRSEGILSEWEWDFGNGQLSDLEDPGVQHYTIPGNVNGYAIRLAVADTAGCTDTSYHLVKVADNCYIAVPNAFTPNGDGLNDYLYPVNAYKARDLVFRVYNRAGQLIFEAKEWTKKWDGRVNGMLQASGVFVWTLDYTDTSQKKVRLTGTATLIR